MTSYNVVSITPVSVIGQDGGFVKQLSNLIGDNDAARIMHDICMTSDNRMFDVVDQLVNQRPPSGLEISSFEVKKFMELMNPADDKEITAFVWQFSINVPKLGNIVFESCRIPHRANQRMEVILKLTDDQLNKLVLFASDDHHGKFEICSEETYLPIVDLRILTSTFEHALYLQQNII